MKCKHRTTRPMWEDRPDGELIPVTRRCADCFAIGIEALAPANDTDTPLGEIVAAEIGQSPKVWARWLNCDIKIDRALDDMGVRGTFGLGASNSAGAHLDPQPPNQWSSRDIGDYLAGWLALRMAESHLEKDPGWDWDVTMPVAGQAPGVCPFHLTADRNADGDCIECHHERTRDAVAIEDALREADDEPTVEAAAEMFGADEYETARAAEPDCRDDDDIMPGWELASPEDEARVAPFIAALRDPNSAVDDAQVARRIGNVDARFDTTDEAVLPDSDQR